ncbi:MAG: hypothetical protein CVT70_05940 [Alphaproteobacteria bacterium HGW-Alphaproteobacteria-1]|nr:MAG: hypothetical protein CVT70_05940 [Alphaproteobacteria bacterium HGW-Alphaproteobacteria-1]
MRYLVTFAGNEDGAVTADWVILTAAVVALAISAIASLDRMTVRLAEDVAVTVSSATVESFASGSK